MVKELDVSKRPTIANNDEVVAAIRKELVGRTRAMKLHVVAGFDAEGALICTSSSWDDSRAVFRGMSLARVTPGIKEGVRYGAKIHLDVPLWEGADATACRNNVPEACVLAGSAAEGAAAIVLFEIGCSAGKPGSRSCAFLGDRLLRVPGPTHDPVRAEALMNKTCEQGDGHSCLVLGLAKLTGKHGLQANQDEAVGLLRSACALRHARGCNILGTLMGRGLGLDYNETSAVAAFQTACDLGDVNACVSYGSRLVLGRGVAPNQALGRSMLRRSCENHKMCSDYDLLASDVHANGRTPWRETCSKDNASADDCWWLWSLPGERPPPNRDVALDLVALEKDCLNSFGEDCTYAAHAASALKESDEVKAKNFMDYGCDVIKRSSSCLMRAVSMRSKGDVGGARASAIRACSSGDFSEGACWQLTEFGVELSEAIAITEPVCGVGHRRACHSLAHHLIQRGTADDLGRVPKLFGQDCAAGLASACVAQAEHQLRQDPSATAAAQALYQQACNLGDAPSCLQVARTAAGIVKDSAKQRACALDLRLCSAAPTKLP